MFLLEAKSVDYIPSIDTTRCSVTYWSTWLNNNKLWKTQRKIFLHTGSIGKRLLKGILRLNTMELKHIVIHEVATPSVFMTSKLKKAFWVILVLWSVGPNGPFLMVKYTDGSATGFVCETVRCTRNFIIDARLYRRYIFAK